MLAHGKRPRVLHWYHAGPMLFGDWGTSRLYVLGLAFFYTRHASFWFMAAMSGLLIGVGWAYQIICRLYPDGGGVYSAARQRSHSLAVIGALLLCADYVVTAALSALDAFHYLDVPRPEIWAAVSIAAVGVLNYFGPTKAGAFALLAAISTIVLTMLIGGAAAPALGDIRLTGAEGSPLTWWGQFTALILAISGVEAVANMTGIMVEPVARTSRRAIWPVLLEIVALNLLLTLAMNAVPLDVLGDGDPAHAYSAHRDDMLRLLADYYIGPTFAAGAALVFALLLLSAVNTAITDLVSIQFMMSRDRELPPWLGGLNRWGMPVIPLVLATVAPLITVIGVPDVGHLADLYAIGVVGAVAVNLGTCSTNLALPLRRWERYAMIGLAAFMVIVWLTIAVEKPWALAFAMSIVGVGLAGRWAAHNRSAIGAWMLAPVANPWQAETAAPVVAAPLSQPVRVAAPPAPASVARSRILVAARGNPRLARFAVEQAALRQADLYVLFVRHLAVPTAAPASEDDARADAEAQSVFQMFAAEAAQRHVAVQPIYAVANDVADTILDIAATHSVDVLLLGASQRGSLWRTMKGDVIQQVSQYLPDSINLLIHA